MMTKRIMIVLLMIMWPTAIMEMISTKFDFTIVAKFNFSFVTIWLQHSHSHGNRTTGERGTTRHRQAMECSHARRRTTQSLLLTELRSSSTPLLKDRLVGLLVKASASRTEDHGFESRLRWDFFGVESYQWLQNWHSSGYPARCLVFLGQCWDWLARCQCSVTGWDGKFGLQLLSRCGST